jgi:Tol biopolymer transport system component
MWFDRTGKAVGTAGPPQRYRSIAVSPDGRLIAAELASERYGTRDIWLIDTTTQALTRLTSNPATDWRPVFSPDGASIAFASDRAGASTVFRMATNGTGGESLVYRNPSGGAFPRAWSRDGKYLVVGIDNPQGRGSGFVIVPTDGAAPTSLLEEVGAVVNMPAISPDGDRIAFAMGAPGSFEVYVMSISDRRRVRVSVDGGRNPTWGPDGRELFFDNARGQIMRALVSRSGLSVDVPPALFFRPCQDVPGFVFAAEQAESNYDMTADGRFVALCDPEDSATSSMTVVVNWQSKLR